MDLGEVLVRDPRYVWRRRAAELARHALVLRSADAPTIEELSLDGGWSCEAVVVSSAHPHAVRLSELRSGRELLVDAGSKGRRQLWVELFASARKSASAVAEPAARRLPPSRADSSPSLRPGSGQVDDADALRRCQKAAEALVPVANLLMRGEDVETLLLQHPDGLATDARSAAETTALLVAAGALEPLFVCDCCKETGRSNYSSRQFYRATSQAASTPLIETPSEMSTAMQAVEPQLGRRRSRREQVTRRRLLWDEDASCLRMLQRLERAVNGLNGTEVVQALLQFGVFNVPTAVALADRMLQDGEIRPRDAVAHGSVAFAMNECASYVRGAPREDGETHSTESKSLVASRASSDEFAELGKRLVDMKRRHDNMLRILCAVCALMALDTWLSSALTTSLKAGASVALLFLFVLGDGSATVAINFRAARGEQQLGGVVTAGFLSSSSGGLRAGGAADAARTASLSDKSNAKPPGNIAAIDAVAPTPVATASTARTADELSSAEQVKVSSFRQAIAQAANVPITETQAFSDVYLLSVMSVKDRAFHYAVTKMAKIVDWRRSFRVDRLTLATIDAEVVARLASGNMYWHGYDFQNRPILWVRAHLKSWATMGSMREAEVRAHVFLIDLCCRELMPPGCSTFTVVSDASHVSTAMVDLRLMHALLDTCVANYPDRIGMVHAGPMNRLLKYLSSALWPFLPVRLRSKVSLMRDCAVELSKHMRFDLIPAYMGGPAEHELNERGDPGALDVRFMVAAQKRRMQALRL